jgi:hypothetical protein
MIDPMRASKWAVTGVVCLILVGACSAANPTESRGPDDTGTDPVGSILIAEPDDPAEVLAGRAVEALGTGGIDVVMRIGAEGFRLQENERLYDVHGDRVLSVRTDSEDGNARLIVRDLAGNLLREIGAGMQVPQTGIVRGDDVYFGGIDFAEAEDPFDAWDRGAWVAHGDAAPESIVAAKEGFVAIYHTFELSPDGRTVGISLSAEGGFTTILMREGSAPVEIPKPGLIALTNDVALLIGQFRDVTAYAISDGAELWHAKTDGAYYERYATADGTRIIISSLEDAGDDDGNSTDQMRLEVMDARTGVVEQTVLVPTEHALSWVAPTLSSDRYVAILDTVLPNADEGPNAVRVVDLAEGRLLDLELMLGDVP